MASGDSLGNRIQLKQAPKMGIINFQILRLLTLTPGLPSRPNQIVIEVAETIASYPNAI